jgi:cyclic 2,3-diphosphoglycerate synthetase
MLAEHLVDRHGAEVAHVSGNLARRDALRAELEQVDADVYVVEIKAAAIDVVAETALARGRELVFADNEVIAAAGHDLDSALLRLAPEVALR